MYEKEHHNDPERVIPVLEAHLRPLARELLGAGFRVVDAWGPIQMAVANLLLERDGTGVLFDAERGSTFFYLIRGERRIGFNIALTAWAYSPAADGRPHAADLIPWSLISGFISDDVRAHRDSVPQSLMYGFSVCEWLGQADLGAIDVVEAETQAIVTWSKRHTKNKPPAVPEQLAARYRDALARYFESP